MMVFNRPSFLLEEELTYKLIGIFINISNEYGFSFKEKVYHQLIITKLIECKIKFQSQPKISLINFKTKQVISHYYPDFIVDDKIIIEIKSQGQIFNNHVNQLIRYLSLTKFEIGLLVNFGSPKVQTIRRIYTNDRKPFFTDSPPDSPPISH